MSCRSLAALCAVLVVGCAPDAANNRAATGFNGFVNQVQRKFSPLYQKRVRPDWRVRTAAQIRPYVGPRWAEELHAIAFQFSRGSPQSVWSALGITGLQPLGEGLVLALPQGQRFWREHPRIRALPQHEVEAAGRAALVAGFESLSAAARFEVVVARDTYAVIVIN